MSESSDENTVDKPTAKHNSSTFTTGEKAFVVFLVLISLIGQLPDGILVAVGSAFGGALIAFVLIAIKRVVVSAGSRITS